MGFLFSKLSVQFLLITFFACKRKKSILHIKNFINLYREILIINIIYVILIWCNGIKSESGHFSRYKPRYVFVAANCRSRMKKQDLLLWNITLLKYFSQILFQHYSLLEETIIEIVEESRS